MYHHQSVLSTGRSSTASAGTKAAVLPKVGGMGGSPGELSEEPVTQEKRKKCWRMNYDVGEATQGLENELWRR